MINRFNFGPVGHKHVLKVVIGHISILRQESLAYLLEHLKEDPLLKHLLEVFLHAARLVFLNVFAYVDFERFCSWQRHVEAVLDEDHVEVVFEQVAELATA